MDYGLSRPRRAPEAPADSLIQSIFGHHVAEDAGMGAEPNGPDSTPNIYSVLWLGDYLMNCWDPVRDTAYGSKGDGD